jgi:hypothetical protein
VKIVGLSSTLVFCSASLALHVGCAAAPQAVYERLLSVNDSLVSYTFDDAIAATKVITLIPGKEKEILVSEADPVFDAGWTRSYFKVLVMEGKPGKSYLVTVRSICNCIGPSKTVLSPYVIAFDDRGEILGEGPVAMRSYLRGHTLHYHLEGTFDLLTGTQKSVYLLVFGDSRDVGSTLGFWVNKSLVFDEEGYSHEEVTESEIVSYPEGIVSLKVEERE